MPKEEYSGLSVKLESSLRTFDGSGSVIEWLAKFNIVKRFSAWTDIEALQMLVLRLEGRALLVYMGMNESDQMDFGKVVHKMRHTFALNADGALDSLLARRWIVGESPEALYAEIVAAIKATTAVPLPEVALFNLARPHFMRIVPKHIRAHLMLSRPATPEALVENTRLLLSSVDEEVPEGQIGAVGNRHSKGRSKNRFDKFKKKRCIRCGDRDHGHAECPFPTSVCWNCKKEGHMSPDCPLRKKDTKRQNAPVVASTEVKRTCGAVNRSVYPMIRVSVSSDDLGARKTSVVAGVDTFSCASICSLELANELGCRVETDEPAELTSLSGGKLDVVGTTSLCVEVETGVSAKIRVAVLRNMQLCQLLLGLDSHPRFARYLVVDGHTGHA